MSQANTSSMEIENTTPVLPFVLDASYKGDEVTRHAATILGVEDVRGWEVVDREEDLALVHYTEDADMTTRGHLRGLLLDLETDTIIADSFGYTPTAVASKLEVVDNTFSIKDTDGHTHYFDVNNMTIKRVFEGVVIRVLWRKGKLYRITHKRINPQKSRWGSSKSFLTMYDEAGGPTAEQLFDTTKPFSSTSYDFLIVDQSLLVGTRQRVNCPYIVCLAQRTVDVKRPAEEVAPGLANFTTSSAISGSINESFIHQPTALSLDEANHHLMYGYYAGFDIADERQLTGEAVIVYTMTDGIVTDIVKVHSPAYDWRVKLRGNNPNIVNQFYCLLNSVYGDIKSEEAWKALKDKYIMFPLYDEQSLKQLYEQSQGILVIPVEEVVREDYYTRDDRIHLLWINYLVSLPPHAQADALKILSNYKADKDAVTKWLQELEETTPNIESAEVSPRVKGIISSARRLARERVAKGDNYSAKGVYMKLPMVIKSTIRNLINKENGPSLYSRIREMRQVQQ